MSVPRSVGQLPVYYNRKMPYSHDYVEESQAPLYPFGYGLSYTTFEYANLRFPGDSVSVDVTNTGTLAGDEVVQIYVRDLVASTVRPRKQLCGFRRVSIGPGECVTVTIPLLASPRKALPEQGLSLPENLRALVVDDDEIACEHAQVVLQAMGIEADTETRAPLAPEHMRAARQEGRPYALLLTDYKMPEMNGLELTRAVRSQEGDDTAVIMLTGYNWDIIDEEARSQGVDSIIAKPLFADSLLRCIHGVLLARSGQAASAAPEESPDKVLAGRRVLMAEDVEQNAEILMDLLELEDVSAERAANGQEAVDMFSGHPAGYYDAILMDVRMPVMDGLTAAAAIRALERPDAREIPIIAMTANVFDEDVERSLQAGMNAHLSKPVEPERLYETLARLIRS